MKMVKVNKIGHIPSKEVLKSIAHNLAEVKVIGEVKDTEGVLNMDMTENMNNIMKDIMIMNIKEMQDMKEVIGMKKVKVVDMAEPKVMAINKVRVKEVKRVRGQKDMDHQFRIESTDTKKMGTMAKNIGEVIKKTRSQLTLKKQKTGQVMVPVKYLIKN